MGRLNPDPIGPEGLMHQPSPRLRPPTRPRAFGLPGLALAACALLAAGCAEERPVPGGPIIGKRTQKIKDANKELKTGKAKQASTKIVAKDYVTLQGNAYRSAISQLSIGQVKHAVDLYEAENGRYPKDYKEFMEEIIKKNNIALPQLPHYLDYGYDEKEHKLIILEYPDRLKEAAQ
jgi:hypothetical protein